MGERAGLSVLCFKTLTRSRHYERSKPYPTDRRTDTSPTVALRVWANPQPDTPRGAPILTKTFEGGCGGIRRGLRGPSEGIRRGLRGPSEGIWTGLWGVSAGALRES
eukprot:1172305-Prorocentrum_minimum.AAC.1